MRLLVYFLITLLFACSSSDNTNSRVVHQGKNLLIHFITPDVLIGSFITDLKASITMNDGSPFELEVNPDNTISGTINNVEPGAYNLVIRYYVVMASVPTTLATVIKRITVVAGEITSVIVIDSDLNKNIDSDGDGYTNLAELIIGTDPNNKFDLPGGELSRYSVGNGSFSDIKSNNFALKARLGESLNGTKTSNNYVIVDGFRVY